ncbi:helix-turn-helix domain-containing protein [bacterium]|nr:helix-turn-helix domain-containing protein [bacterium]
MSRQRASRNRLQSHQIAEIHRLRAAGHTQMEIKRITGISRTTIHHVLTGKHASMTTTKAEADQAPDSSFFDGPIERCPQCGCRAHMPCLACKVKNMIEKGQIVRSEIQETDRRKIAQRW